jgi:hypothetical protein
MTIRSSTVLVIILSIGESITPMKMEPPTQIEAATRCNHTISPSVRRTILTRLFNIEIRIDKKYCTNSKANIDIGIEETF